MVSSLHWKEKVVRNIVLAAMLVYTISFAQAQSSAVSLHNRTFHFSYPATSLQTVVDHIAHTTGLHVMYSSNKINMTLPVSMVVRNKTLTEILTSLEQQTNLTFRIQDNHLIIKPAATAYRPATVSVHAPERRPFNRSAVLKIRIDSTLIPAAPEVRKEVSLSEEKARSFAHLLYNVPTLTHTRNLRALPTSCYQRMNTRTRHRGWFVSAGTIVNDYSAGVELQAGLRQVYAVFTPSWLSSDRFRGGIGLGTSIPLSWNMSLNPIYNYSELLQKKSYTSDPGSPVYTHVQFRSQTRHHQFKMMMQYALSPSVRIAVGPALNYTSTRSLVSAMRARNVVIVAPLPAYETHPVMERGVVIQKSAAAENLPVIRTWLGWEASLSYRIQFYRKN